MYQNVLKYLRVFVSHLVVFLPCLQSLDCESSCPEGSVLSEDKQTCYWSSGDEKKSYTAALKQCQEEVFNDKASLLIKTNEAEEQISSLVEYDKNFQAYYYL